MNKHTLLFNTLPLTRSGTLRNCLADHGHEVAIFGPRESGEFAKLMFGAELDRRLLRVVQNLV